MNFLKSFSHKKNITLVTHGSNFHADDICATATLKTFFAYAFPKLKVTVKRSLDEKVWNAADIVYDIGKVHNPKTLRFDHHQRGGAGARVNGTQYAAFGLVWKEFGVELCRYHVEKNTGKKATKKQAERMSEIIEKRFVSHIDAMDNGQMTYTEVFKDTSPITLDNYFEMCKIAISSQGDDMKKANKKFDTGFFYLVKMTEDILKHALSYALYKQRDESLATAIYTKAKDKRMIVCDRFYYFNFAKFPLPLVTIYPDMRNGFAAKVVKKDETAYDARFYFPKAWAGLNDAELEKVSGVPGARFCHNACFLITASTQEAIILMVQKSFAFAGI